MAFGEPVKSVRQPAAVAKPLCTIALSREWKAVRKPSVAPPTPAAGEEGGAQAVGCPADAARGGGRHSKSFVEMIRLTRM